MQGKVPRDRLSTLLKLLAAKGECVAELVGAARAMRASSVTIACDDACIDTCGTGGDGVSTFNVSTTAAIIAAGAGASVAKHGNTSATRRSGSTEALRELGIDTNADKDTVERCLNKARIGYLNARLLHPAMKHAAPVRQSLSIRTIFNLLGPLTNPAGVSRQLLGVPRPDLVDLMAEALRSLGVERAWVIHGDGLCDVTITGSTIVSEITSNSTRRFVVAPEDAGLQRAPVESLLIESPSQSAEAIREILSGHAGPKRDHALMNAGAALVVAGLAPDLRDGVAQAAEAINSGNARKTLELWRRVSHCANE